MNILDTLLGVGEAVVSAFVPHGDKLIKIIKDVSGEDVPDDITGEKLAKIVKGMTPEATVAIHESYNRVIINESDNYRKMQESFSNNERFGGSKRGEGVILLIKASICWTTIFLFGVLGVMYKTGTYPDAWLVAAIFSFPYTIIGAYYGVKSAEIKSIVNSGKPSGGGLKDAIVSRISKGRL